MVIVEMEKEWKSTTFYPMGRFRGVLGEAGEIGPETEALLVQNDVDFRGRFPHFN